MNIEFRRSVTTIVKATALFVLSVICASIVAVVIIVVSTRETLVRTAHLVGDDRLATVVDSAIGPEEPLFQRNQMADAASSDHGNIREWISDCRGRRPTEMLPALIATGEPGGGQGLEFEDPARVVSDRRFLRDANSLEKSVNSLSAILFRHRVELDARVKATYEIMEIATIATILIGLMTTILVSISATEFGRGDGLRQRIIRIAAIVFPALGTAVAAVIAFYSPQAQWSQASRTLASLTQLHSQMALAVWKLPCIDQDSDPNRAGVLAQIDEWANRYTDIQTVSTDTSAGAAGGGNELSNDRPPMAPAPSGGT